MHHRHLSNTQIRAGNWWLCCTEQHFPNKGRDFTKPGQTSWLCRNWGDLSEGRWPQQEKRQLCADGAVPHLGTEFSSGGSQHCSQAATPVGVPHHTAPGASAPSSWQWQVLGKQSKAGISSTESHPSSGASQTLHLRQITVRIHDPLWLVPLIPVR